MQAETLEAKILGGEPIPTDEALALVDDPRTDIYAAIQATDGAIMKFDDPADSPHPSKNSLWRYGTAVCAANPDAPPD